jgi:formylglycine-generating enzyme required for sulfatase activity
VIRGGSWGNDAATCRSAKRDKQAPDACLCDLGFRVVCELP